MDIEKYINGSINRKYQIVYKKIMARPLCLPAFLLVLIILIMYYLWPGVFVPKVDEVNKYQSTFEADVVSVNKRMDGTTEYVLNTSRYGKVLYYADSDSIKLDLGCHIKVNGVIHSPDKPTNPGEFNYYDYTRRKGISYVLYEPANIELLALPGRMYKLIGSYHDCFYRLRSLVLSRVSNEQTKALMSAIFIGDKSLIDNKTNYEFSHSGCSHILAVSGAHITGFLFFVPRLLEALKLNRRKSGILYVFLCIAIGSFTGWSESVSRATIMSCCCYYSRDYLSGMSLACLLMVIVNPLCVLSMGFQMSFVAALSIYVLTPMIKKRIGIKGHNKAIDLLVAYVAVQLGMISFYSISSTRISLIGTLVQILSGSLAGIACALFVPCILLSFIPVVGDVFIIPIGVILRVISGLAAISSKLNRYSLNLNRYSRTTVTLIVLLIISCIVSSSFIRKASIRIITCLLALAIGINVYSYLNRAEVILVFIDVGQGDCCLIITPNSTCIIDSGVSDVTLNKVIPVLDYYGIDQVDYAIATHYDLDHAGGFGTLYNLGRIGCLYAPNTSVNSDTLEVWQSSLANHIEPLSKGDRIRLSSSVTIEIMSPLISTNDSNDNSLVAMLKTSCSNVLFTGDISSDVEKTLIYDYGNYLHADVLKVAHHGSRYSSSKEFLDCVNPSIAVISVGANNLYGHPTKEVLDRLEDSDINVQRTDTSGAIIISIRGQNISIQNFVGTS